MQSKIADKNNPRRNSGFLDCKYQNPRDAGQIFFIADELQNSISNLAGMNLPDDTYVVHGHGDDSMIGGLRQNNPYFKVQ